MATANVSENFYKASRLGNSIEMKKLIITGAAGEVGLNLVKLLRGKRYELVCIDKNLNNLRLLKRLFPYVRTVHADLAEKGSWEKDFKGAYACIQLQAQISSPFEEPYLRNNVGSVRNVISACERYKIKLIHASSSVVISVADDRYTRTKRQGEEIVKKSKSGYTVLRPTLMYGCFDIKHTGFLARFFSFPIFPMPGSGKYMRQPLYVDDFARIIISCIERKPANKEYNITGKEKIYLIDMLKEYARKMDKKIFFLRIPIPVFHAMIWFYGLFNSKTRIIPEQLTALIAGDIFPVILWEKIFKVKPTRFKDGVKEMVSSEFYKYEKKMTRIEK